MTSNLYQKVYNLFHQWLSTEEEDEEEFQEWLNNQFIYQNGKVMVHLTIIPQNKSDSITVDKTCAQIQSQRFGSGISVNKSALLPLPSNENQPIQVMVNNTLITPSSNGVYILFSQTANGGCPGVSSFDVYVTIEEYIENNVCYQGLKYKFTIPSLNSTSSVGVNSFNCNVEVIE